MAVLAVVLVALGFLVFKGLNNATLYFYNADEAVAQRDHLGDRRFRLQGTVVGDTVRKTSDGVQFTVAFNGARVEVHHVGDPPELFQPDIPVVLEGRWAAAGGAWFASDRMMVKHSAAYEAENQDRLKEAQNGSSNSP
jgi:cytochrome c-type biogenesis protein CcmE